VGDFRREWPLGVEMSEAVAERAIAIGLDLVWFAENHFGEAEWRAFHRAETVAYERRFAAKAAAREQFAIAMDARREYDRTIASAFVAGWRATVLAAEQEEARADGPLMPDNVGAAPDFPPPGPYPASVWLPQL